MATQEIQKVRWHSGEHRVVCVPEASSQSFKKGEFVYLASGLATVCASNGVTIYGLAMEDASGTASTTPTIDVIVATDATVFEGNVYHGTAASAVTAITNIGVKYALYVASNIHYVDIGDTSYDAFVIEKILDGGGKALGDTYGRVAFRVIAAAQQCDAIAT